MATAGDVAAPSGQRSHDARAGSSTRPDPNQVRPRIRSSLVDAAEAHPAGQEPFGLSRGEL